MFGESEEMNHETKWKGPHRQLNISHDARNHRLPKYRRKKKNKCECAQDQGSGWFVRRKMI